MSTLTASNRQTIKDQGIAFADSHPGHSVKEIVEAFEAIWFESALSDEQVMDASAYLESCLRDTR